MIVYEMDSSLAGVYTTTKTYPVENVKHGWKYDMVVATMAKCFAKEALQRSSLLGNLELSDKKLGLQRTPTRGIFFYCVFSSLSAISTIASNTFVLG